MGGSERFQTKGMKDLFDRMKIKIQTYENSHPGYEIFNPTYEC